MQCQLCSVPHQYIYCPVQLRWFSSSYNRGLLLLRPHGCALRLELSHAAGTSRLRVCVLKKLKIKNISPKRRVWKFSEHHNFGKHSAWLLGGVVEKWTWYPTHPWENKESSQRSNLRFYFTMFTFFFVSFLPSRLGLKPLRQQRFKFEIESISGGISGSVYSFLSLANTAGTSSRSINQTAFLFNRAINNVFFAFWNKL